MGIPKRIIREKLEKPNGYLESDKQYLLKNTESSVWALDNAHNLAFALKNLLAAVRNVKFCMNMGYPCNCVGCTAKKIAQKALEEANY